jgi:hypothetical protein
MLCLPNSKEKGMLPQTNRICKFASRSQWAKLNFAVLPIGDNFTRIGRDGPDADLASYSNKSL